MPDIKFISHIEVKEGKKVLKAAKNAGIKLDDSCDGKGKCGKCLVKLIEGKLSEPTKEEEKLLGDKKLKQGLRLACQAEIIEDAVFEIIND